MEATCALYGLIHARYVLTTAGLEAMYAKYTLRVRAPAAPTQKGDVLVVSQKMPQKMPQEMRLTRNPRRPSVVSPFWRCPLPRFARRPTIRVDVMVRV